MAGPDRQLIGLGHDLQLVSELEAAPALGEPGVFFTAEELARCSSAVLPLESLAGAFAAKEALFKALPAMEDTWFWTDAELVSDQHGAPRLRAHGALADYLARHQLAASVSISHSGGFVSAIVAVTGEPAVPDAIKRMVRRVLRRIAPAAAGAPQ